MDFKIYNNRNEYTDHRSLTSAVNYTEPSVSKEVRHEDYDQVTIHSDLSQFMADRAAFGGEDASASRIFSLRQQIASGTYQTDSRRIAECMLERRSMPGIF